MKTVIEALELALSALKAEKQVPCYGGRKHLDAPIKACEEALAQLKQGQV